MDTQIDFINEKIAAKEEELKSRIEVLRTYSEQASEIIGEIEKLSAIKLNLIEKVNKT